MQRGAISFMPGLRMASAGYLSSKMIVAAIRKGP